MKSKLLGACAIAFLSTIHYQLFAPPQPSTAFTYQGKLTDSSSPAQGSYDLRFALYDSQVSGTQQGSTLTNSATAVSNGLFTVTLDFGSVFNGYVQWLEIGVRANGSGAFTTLASRQPVTPAPYATYAVNAAVATSAATANTALSASSVAAANVTGTLGLAQLPAGVLTNNQSGVTFRGLTTVSNLSVTGTNFVKYLVVTNPPALNGSAITNLNAASLIGTLAPTVIASGTIASNMLATGAVGASQLAAGAVTTSALANGAVTSAKLGSTSNWTSLKIQSSPPAEHQVLGLVAATVGNNQLLLTGFEGSFNNLTVYSFDTNGVPLTVFHNPSGVSGSSDDFGACLAALGQDRVLIGAYGAGSNYQGAAYLFNTNGALLATITNPVPAYDAAFGYSIAVLQDSLAIGAPAAGTNPTSRIGGGAPA